jgi:hypothetical protein
LSILELENNSWIQRIQQDITFDDYNPLGTVNTQDSHTIDLQTLENIEDIFTQIGKYQVYIEFDDAADNQSRVILYFDIIPGDIDVIQSTLETVQRNTLSSDYNDYYTYTLALKDEYLNPIV